MTRTIELPDFDFSGMYYAEILESLLAFKRQNCPELTDESDEEPSIQLLRSFALVGHLNNTLIDLVAINSTLPTADLVEVVRNMLRLIDYEMLPATPSQVEVVYELSKIFSTATEIISEDAQAATNKEGDIEAVPFESLESLTTDPTDEFSYVLGQESGVFTDHTTDANNQILGNTFQPVVTMEPGDEIYFGHKHIMWDKLAFVFDTPAAFGSNRVLEFYDGRWSKGNPNSVTVISTTLEFDLTDLLGAVNRAGTEIRVLLNSSTVYENVISTWDGGKNVATTSLLGQVSASVDPVDYTVGSDWTEITLDEDGTSGLTVDGTMSYPLPQTSIQNWAANEVDNKTAFWLRLRIIVGTGAGPIIEYVRLDTGKQYAIRTLTQGQIVTDPVSSSAGVADQEIDLAQDDFVWDSEEITVDGDVWTRVDNFLNSEATAKHYVMKLGENDHGIVVFGSGTKGKIPPAGAGNIAKTYRYGAQNDGNVGANTVIVDNTGLTYVNKLWNPRQATGWTEAEGASEESLERVKREAPATARIKDVALSPDDVVDLTIAFVSDVGTRPFVRAQAFEEGFGPKTMELVVVASGGTATASQLAAIEQYFNGDRHASPPVKKHLVANQEVGAVDYTQKVIDVTATVYGNTTIAAVENQLAQYIQPEAKEDDEITWMWKFGGEVPTSKISKIIFDTNTSIWKVEITIPATNVTLQKRELPILGVTDINIVLPS
jgi:hypothetical protein